MSQPPDDPRERVAVTARPWGRFCTYTTGREVTVKIMTVEPGQRLSLQRHALRGEMWELLDEPLLVTVGAETWTARPGERLWVAPGAVHRISNEGERAGRVLEVAFGAFDEDDIERLEDDYQRD